MSRLIDPLGHYKGQGYPYKNIEEELGLVLSWVDEYDKDTLINQLKDRYGYTPPLLEGKVEDGIYKSPHKDDSDLYPLYWVNREEENLIFFPYGIIAYVNNSSNPALQEIYRMD